MKAAVEFLLIFLVLLEQSESIQINCEFRLDSIECKVNSLKVLETDMEVTSIAGVYGNQKSNKDVTEFWVDRGVDTERVPTNICKFFINMERIDIYGSKITKITRKVFNNCSKVRQVFIQHTSLVLLPEDLFEDLGELQVLFLYGNKLVNLPGNLIAKNLKLIQFNATSNQLKTIDIEFGDKITNIDLSNNKCIDKSFPRDVLNLSVFKKLIAENCENPMKKSLELKANEIAVLKASLAEKENEIRNLKSEKEVQRVEKNREVSKLKVENEGYRIEIEAIKIKNSKQIDATNDENISLKLNLDKCLLNVTKLSKTVQELNSNNENKIQEIKKLKSFIRELNANISDLQTKLHLVEMENLNFNKSLEECRQNFTSITKELVLKVDENDLLNMTVEENLREINNIKSSNEDMVDKLYLMIIEDSKLNQSLEECLQIFTSINKNTNTSDLENTSMNTTCQRFRLKYFANSERNCDSNIRFQHFILLFVIFLIIFILTVIFMRLYVYKKMMNQTTSDEINMSNLHS